MPLAFVDDKGFNWRVKKAFRGEETAELTWSLVRLTIAQQLKTAVVLDDHVVQTDAVRGTRSRLTPLVECGTQPLPSPGREEVQRLQDTVGEWLSLVEHLVRDQGVAGSNPVSPTI